MSGIGKTLLLWTIILVLVLSLVSLFDNTKTTAQIVTDGQQLSYSEFLDAVEAGSVKEVVIQGDIIHGTYTDGATVSTKGGTGSSFSSQLPQVGTVIDILRAKNVMVTALLAEEEGGLFEILLNWLPMAILVGIWIYFLLQMQSKKGKSMDFSRLRSYLLTEETGEKSTGSVTGKDRTL